MVDRLRVGLGIRGSLRGVAHVQPEDAVEHGILYPLTPITFPSGVPTCSLFIDGSVPSLYFVL